MTDTDDSKFVQFSYSGGKLITRNNSTNTTTAQFTLDESGRLGIGTTSPGNRLNVEESSTEAFVNASDSILRLTNTNTSSDTNQTSIAFTTTTTGVGSDSAIVSQSISPGNTDLEFYTDSSNGLTEKLRIVSDGNVRVTSEHLRIDTSGRGIIFGTEGGNDRPSIIGEYTSATDNLLKFNVTGTERMRINSDGKIDLNASVAKFGNSHSTGTTYLFGNDIRFTNAGITTTTMTIDSSAGRVGIGTASPQNKLAINYTVSSSSPGGGIRLQDDTNTTVTTLETTVSSYNYAGVSGHHSLLYGSRNIAIAADGATNGVIKLFAGNAERMRVHNNQFTSFGTGGDTIIYNHSLSDSYVGGVVLDGLGAIQVARHNDQCLLLNRMGPDGTIQTFYNDGTCVGFISVSGSTTAYSTNCSDRTLKKNFEDWTENTLSYFKNIKPQKFNFITEEDTVDKTKGYVAQDLVNSFPEAYPKNDEGKYVFNPSGMVVYLMKALQEVVARIEALEAG